MEIGGNFFTGGGDQSNGNRGQNGNLGWDIWELNSSRFDWNNNNNGGGSNADNNIYHLNNTAATAEEEEEASISTLQDVSGSHALLFSNSLQQQYYDDDNHHHLYNSNHHIQQQHHHNREQQPLYGGGGPHLHPDPHLMCLKLGKRHYFEDTTTGTGVSDRHVAAGVSGFSVGTKRGRPYYIGLNQEGYTTGADIFGYGGGGGSGCLSEVGASSMVVVGQPTVIVPRCQVEGCHVSLVNAKEYHRRHKVCELHSKSPKVMVVGLEQRFCQQCSRFHVVSEFDESKRSCRRRLAGHNERRRKTSHDSISRNSSQDNKLITGGFPCISSSSSPSSNRGGGGAALSLLSSWVSPSDLSSRSSAALTELIAENRAAVLARQLLVEPTQQALIIPGHEAEGNGSKWDCSKFHGSSGSSKTLDLMHEGHEHEHDHDHQQCSDNNGQMWNYSLEGGHVCSLRY